jgi:hypothetical protein
MCALCGAVKPVGEKKPAAHSIAARIHYNSSWFGIMMRVLPVDS